MNRVTTAISILILLLISCGEKERIVEVPVASNCPPSAPRGVYATNYDGTVLICWWANPESDIDGYDVYRSTAYDGDYEYQGTVADDGSSADFCFEDLDTDNGVQYYYAVVAFDEGGLESDLSYENVTGTPRPEGHITLRDYVAVPAESGFDLSLLSNVVQVWNAPTTDLFYSGAGDAALIVTYRAGVDIQDYGYTGDFFDVINYAPADGWSPTGSVEAIPQHTYILRLLETDGYHYAKLYVESATASYVTFWWAYQTDPGNRDLAPAAPGAGGTARAAASGTNEKTQSLAARSAIPPIVEKRVAWTRDGESAQRIIE